MTISIDNLYQSKAKEGKATVSIFEESMLNPAASYNLLCTIDHEFIGLSIVDKSERRLCGFEAFHLPKSLNNDQLAQKISKLSDESTILRKIRFQKISVQIVNNYYTFIPSALFRKEDAEEYYFFNHGKEADVLLKTNAISAFDLVTVFSVPQAIHAGLKKIFDQFDCYHHTSSLLHSVRIEGRKKEAESVFINFHSGFMDVVVTKGKKLILCNTFSYKSNEDALYYLLFISEQLSLNPEQVPVTISGEIEKSSALSSLLQSHLRNISFTGRIKSAKFAYGFNDLPPHFYYSVFSHILCES